MNVVMVGSGYVGLVSGVCFAEFGASVTCIDSNSNLINDLNDGHIPIYEPGLDLLLKNNSENGKLKFSCDLRDAVKNADLIFIAVGTPSRRGDGHADLKYVYKVAEEISESLTGYTVIVDKSTVPVGTAREVKRLINKNNPNADFDIASNPEFLREGSAINDFMEPDRVILGLESEKAEKYLKNLYAPLIEKNTSIITTDLESAELIKYASNAFLATKISFINELSHLCEKTGANIKSVSEGMGLDDRIGSKFLNVGPGYGGSCFPKDTIALIRTAQEHGVSSRIVEAVVEVNASQKARMVSKIKHALGGTLINKKISVLGLTFKPETDDMRDAPSLTIIPSLLDKGAIIKAHDPQGINEAKNILPKNIEYSNDMLEIVKKSDAIVLMTEWDEYKDLDLDNLRSLMQGDVFIDLRNIYNIDEMELAGFQYHSIGR